MNCAAPPASTITRYSAACTTFLVVTTPSAETTIAAAMIEKKTFSAIMSCPSLLAFHLGALLERLRVGHGRHPLAESVLVVGQGRDPRLGVLKLGTPEQGVEGAYLDADPAVHAQRVVDVETVEDTDVAGFAAFASWRTLLLVALDIEARVGTLAGAKHADGAVLFLQRDPSAGARRRVFTLVRILHRDRRFHHRLE